MAKGITDYSEKVAGTRGNFNQPVRFDKTDGFLGVTQFDESGGVKDRVLLSPAQVKQMIGFVTNKTMNVDRLRK